MVSIPSCKKHQKTAVAFSTNWVEPMGSIEVALDIIQTIVLRTNKNIQIFHRIIMTFPKKSCITKTIMELLPQIANMNVFKAVEISEVCNF